jgi:zinc/manganese transport system permease protein
MLWPVIVCLILSIVHAYLGLHVVSRGVIFVDLALAQLAALGALVGLVVGVSLHTPASYFWSLGFTLAGALFFSFTRESRGTSRVPHEAVIGGVYAVAAAAAVLILNSVPAEAEHLKDMLVGNLLFVGQAEVLKIALLYGVVGGVHFVFRKTFWQMSEHVPGVSRGRLWDFLFYALFGIVVTSSVEIAGVLLVFSYLIIPSLTAFFLSDRLGSRIAIAWMIGIVASVAGVGLSMFMDWPTGPAIICVLGGFSFLIAVAQKLFGTVYRLR